MTAIFTRRSVRDFLDKPVEPEKLERVLRAAFEAPSAHNRRPWEFLVLTDQKDREAVAGMSPWAKMCLRAPVVLAACVDLRKGDPDYEASSAAGLVGADAAAGEDIFWIQDISAAVENVLLQIAGEGLGGVWLGWYPGRSRVRAFMDAFGLPPYIVPAALVALGYPAKETHPKDRFDPAKVHYGRYGAPGTA
ncbi:MAG: nitroreductase family protein [Treponema sp.]|jgi:nitroreductase|nr:nitroreductase family protein [Treponema sp.]